MGLGNLVHWIAWFIQSFVFVFVSVLLFCIVIKVRFFIFLLKFASKIDFFVSVWSRYRAYRFLHITRFCSSLLDRYHYAMLYGIDVFRQCERCCSVRCRYLFSLLRALLGSCSVRYRLVVFAKDGFGKCIIVRNFCFLSSSFILVFVGAGRVWLGVSEILRFFIPGFTKFFLLGVILLPSGKAKAPVYSGTI